MWATSIGSTFAHRPVIGVRKSGMPEGTEMPAPVRATTGPEDRISEARRSAPTELRRALLDERVDALAGVRGAERGHEAVALRLQPRVEVRAARDALDLLDRQRRLARGLARPQQRRVEQLVVVDDAVDEPDLQRLDGVDRLAEQVQLQRAGRADEAREPLRAPEARDDAEVDLGLAEGGAQRRQPEVAGPRALAAAAVREPVDRRDGDHRGALPLAAEALDLSQVLASRRLIPLREGLDVRPRAE